MKIYLQDKNYTWKEVEYTELSEISSEFEICGIEIGARAKIGARAEIGADAKIGAYAKIGDDAVVLRGIYLWAGRHAMTYCGSSMVSIGCHCHSIADWIANYQEIGKKENYSQSEIEHYGEMLRVMESFISVVEK